VQKGDTLASLAKKFGIDVACLAHNNVYVSGESKASEVGKPLGTGAGLKTGQVLKIPDNAQCKAMGYKS
jgi:LysM repeat protein